jgi:hypothetical protein
MSRLITLYFPAQDPQLLLPTTVAGGAATASIPLATPYPFIFPNLARTITLTSSDNLSAVNFTIHGTDQFGNAISEVLVGPNNDTVTSVNQYNTIVAIASSGNYTNFSIGSGSTGTFQWIKFNTFNVDPNITISAEVVGTINYTINQTIDSLGGYVTVGPFFKYVQTAAPILLGNNPIETTNGLSSVVVTVPSTAGLVTGDIITIAGATTTNAITNNELNIRAAITVLSPTTFSYFTTGTANATGAGGGANVTYTFPPLPVSFPVTANLTAATTNQIYAMTSPVTALQGIVNSSSPGGSLIINFLQQGII